MDDTGTASPIKVILIDDSAEVRYLIGMALQDDGRFDVVGEARDASAGLRCVQALDPDLVVVDLGLGRRSGHWVLRQLRHRDVDARLAVVTGSAETADTERAHLAGADLVLSKDTLTTTMVDALAGLCQQPHALAAG